MKESFWSMFCDDSECSTDSVNKCCSSGFSSLIGPYSTSNMIVIVSADILLLLIIFSISIHKSVSRNPIEAPSRYLSPLLCISSIFNVILGLSYLGLGGWILAEKFKRDHAVLPIYRWAVNLLQGFTWLAVNFILCLPKLFLPYISAMKVCSVFTFLLAGFLCISSVMVAFFDTVVSFQMILNALTFPGAVLLLSCCFKRHISIENHGLYVPLASEKENATPFARAGFFSKMSFWWLNPLMKKGKDKILEDEDIPLLRQEDRAQTCYLAYMEKVRKLKQEQKGSSDSPSMISVIISLHWKQILISGLYALIKVLTTSSGPLFLKAFIDVAEGKEAFKYEGYALTVGLLLAKCLESLSERQWFFRTRLVGLQVRSMLSAAIFQKQLKLSNAAKTAHSPGEIVNYVASDAYRIGEFPYWFHQIWTTSTQLGLALAIVYYTVGLAAIAAFIAIVLTVLASSPLVKTQLKYQRKLLEKQDERLKAITEALSNMKVLKLYAWETHFKKLIDKIREEEIYFISKVLLQKAYNLVLFWSCPIVIPTVTFWTCYLLRIPLSASSVFTFLATLHLAQDPVSYIPEVLAIFIEAKVSLDRIQRFLEEPELQKRNFLQDSSNKEIDKSILIRASEIFWDANSSTRATLRNINLAIEEGEMVAVCGEVGSGKSTLLAALLGEVPKINGTVHVDGNIAYVPQVAWIQTGTIQENILFGSKLDEVRYQEVIERCSLVKDLEMFQFGDLTQIGEKGVNLSGGQKQRIQLARALYHDADVYLLDDPFSAVDAHTATFLFNEYVLRALSGKTVLLVTHQVDFLPAFYSILLMSGGEIIRQATYEELMASSQEFQDLVNAHKNTAGSSEGQNYIPSGERTETYKDEIQKAYIQEQLREPMADQLIKEEEREVGDTGFKPYMQYLRHGKGFLYFSVGNIFHVMFLIGQLIQNYWLAANIENFHVSRIFLFTIYTTTGLTVAFFMLLRSLSIVPLGCGASRSIFSTLSASLFRAPMSFYDSTPIGRILSRVSFDLSIIDIEVAYRMITIGIILTSYSNFAVLAFLTWPVLFVIIPMVYISSQLQTYYYASTKELMRNNGTSKSSAASQFAESIAGAMVIRAFKQEDQFFSKNLDLIDRNASSYFHYFTANEWLIQRLEILCAIVLSSTTLAMVLLKLGDYSPGFIGMELSYGLSLNTFLVGSIQFQCLLSSSIISVERLEQYLLIPSEAPEVIEGNRPDPNWPAVGKVEICNLKVRYRPNAPLVLDGISCNFEGGHKIGIVGRTRSGKTTLISALFRLVEPAEGKIVIDGIDISTIGLHDLRSHLAIIPQEPTLFVGSVRYNLDPFSNHTDEEIWQVVEKCHLQAAIQEKEGGLDSPVTQDGLNWSMGQRQLFCLGRALLKRSKILVLDEATASIDNATDSVIQKTIRTEFADCTVITVAHRIPTVVNCTMVLAISDGKLAEYDEPLKLMSTEGSIFGQLVKEYWSHTNSSSTSSSFSSENWQG
ncbi:ABC transporter C family member 10-like isoform X1 [Euphorbia lathyris]|uniref:ABC transporter C family member 10-like isoform X1 n=2 Tax=Euphorbia lathyris TaxID=212925 RepID=UPI0033141CD1